MNQGTATLRRGTDLHGKPAAIWEVDAPPHVMLRLKRVFPKLEQRRVGAVRFTATAENCRDLEWFATRFPLQFEPEDALGFLTDEARRYDSVRARVRATIEGARQVTVPQMALPPRDYQKSPAALVMEQGGLLLADELGLGKTVSAIVLLAHAQALPAVAVVPTHLQHQWKAEILRFLPMLKVHIARKGNPQYLDTWKGKRRAQEWPADVLILPYSKLAGWAEFLQSGWHSVVYDEVQDLRRTGTGSYRRSFKYEAAQLLSTSVDYRIGLSATPIYNYGMEFYNVIECLLPGTLGSRFEFATEWCDRGATDDKARIRDPKAFGAMLRDQGIMLRRTRADVNRELPPLTKIVHEFEPDPAALEAVEDRASELARILLESSGDNFGKMRAAEELSNQLRMQTGIAKAPYVAEFVRMLIEESDEPVVLFGWHRAVYDLWASRLAAYEPAFYTGTESPNQKERAKQRFLNGETKVLIVSLRSGAGLDGLQRVCHRAVFGELDWSHGVHEQCEGRVYRDGQSEATLAYYLVATDGADPVIADVLGVKRAQLEGVRSPESTGAVPKQVDPQHIKRLAKAWLGRKALKGGRRG